MMMDRAAVLAALEWQVALGVDEAVGDWPVDRFAPPPSPAEAAAATPAPAPAAAPAAAASPGQGSAAIAAACADLAALRAALEAFEGSALKRGARSTVFADGLPGARVMIVGEEPGREEDAAGRPFVGASGQLLDRMLDAIGLSRAAADPASAVYITNVLPWRPPANRDPAADEVALIEPFVLRHIELAKPEILVLMGARAAQVVLGTTEGIGRLRGRWRSWRGIPALPMLHPDLLLRDPSRKRDAWEDLKALRARLDGGDA